MGPLDSQKRMADELPPQHPVMMSLQETCCCSERSVRPAPKAFCRCDSMAAVLANAQQQPQVPWFFADVTMPSLRAS